jgi:hypothetical protein
MASGYDEIAVILGCFRPAGGKSPGGGFWPDMPVANAPPIKNLAASAKAPPLKLHAIVSPDASGGYR